MATTARYLRADNKVARTHDMKLEEVELYLLDKILNASNPTAIRQYAEAYALIKATVNTVSMTEVKS